jgi:pilus retraction protein PilT
MLESPEGVSDLLFISGKPPLVEIHGRLNDFPIDTTESVLTPALIEQLAGHIMNGSERLRLEFSTTGSCDCSYAIENLARFRVNIFKQNGRHAIVMRKLQSQIPSLDLLGLPPVFREIVKEKEGIVLLTGGTGTGKTTTLAAMLNELNETQEIHIVTLEDPIEFYHTHRKAAVSQRELGKDFPNFADGLRAALREAPKAILVGEIRDRETLELAMTASETGHIVFSTPCIRSTPARRLNRILGMFSREEEPQVRQRPRRDVALRRQPAAREQDRWRPAARHRNHGRSHADAGDNCLRRIREQVVPREIIEAGSSLAGRPSINRSSAAKAGVITEETALVSCTSKESPPRTGLAPRATRRPRRADAVRTETEHSGADSDFYEDAASATRAHPTSR